MRAGLNTIQQTLTPEALSVLNSSIAEAGRRNHGQTTPLHVAAALLSSPTGFLRRACIKSHPNSSHPLQCRALELCFSVALDRIPTVQASGGEPPISNALMAALKRAQAHQRRGCPEQQQQPLLAVKVELEQLIMSILDDPSVSRVMREASFSSPAVKAEIEQSLNTSAPPSQPPLMELGFRSPATTPILPGRNLYLNPRFQGGSVQTGSRKIDEVEKIVDILLGKKKKNPVLVGDSEPENVIKELFKRFELNQLDKSELKNIKVIPLRKEFFSEIPTKIEELKNSIESRLMSSIGGGIVLNLGDLKWLVEQPPITGAPSEIGKVAVSEIGKLVSRFGDDRFWMIGTATCETYLRCQVYYPSQENDWDLQAIPIASRAPLPGLFPRIEGNGFVISSVQSVNPIRMTVSQNFDSVAKTSCCPQCMENCEQELAKYEAEEAEKSSSELKTEAAAPPLPPWLKNAKAGERAGTDQRTQSRKEKAEELRKKWIDSCLLLHPSFHPKSSQKISSMPVPSSLYNSNLLNPEKNSPVPVPRSLYNPDLLSSEKISPVPVPRSLYNLNLLSSEKISTVAVPRNPNLLSSEKISPVPVPVPVPVPRSLYNPNLLSSEKISPVPVPRNPNLLSSEKISPVPVPRNPNLVSSEMVSLAVPRSLYNPNLLGVQSIQPKLQPSKNAGQSLQLNMISKLEKPADRVISPPGSPVGTNLIVGQNPNKILADKLLSILDPDPFKKLLKTLTDKLWWQKEAASAVATTVMQCKIGNGKRRSGGSKGDTWLLFVGPDRVGKRKMASALAETVTGSNPVIISLGSDWKNVDSNASFRGRTVMDRISKTIRTNPSSVIMLEEIDEADLLVRGSIKRALEKGRLTDSHGREISISNIIFILTATWLPENIKRSPENNLPDEQKIYSLASSNWQLRLCVSKRRTKRRADCQVNNVDRSIKQRSNNGFGFGFDLNELAEVEEDRADGSFNSSQITVEGEDDRRTASSLSWDLRDTVDDAIVFKQVELEREKQTVRDAITKRWSAILREEITLEVQEVALEKITAGMWLGTIGMEEWVEKSLVPGFRRLNAQFFYSTEPTAVRLELDSEMGSRSEGEWLPDSIVVAV